MTALLIAAAMSCVDLRVECGRVNYECFAACRDERETCEDERGSLIYCKREKQRCERRCEMLVHEVCTEYTRECVK